MKQKYFSWKFANQNAYGKYSKGMQQLVCGMMRCITEGIKFGL